MGVKLIIQGTQENEGDKITVVHNENRWDNLEPYARKLFKLMQEAGFLIQNKEGPFREVEAREHIGLN